MQLTAISVMDFAVVAQRVVEIEPSQVEQQAEVVLVGLQLVQGVPLACSQQV